MCKFGHSRNEKLKDSEEWGVFFERQCSERGRNIIPCLYYDYKSLAQITRVIGQQKSLQVEEIAFLQFTLLHTEFC